MTAQALTAAAPIAAVLFGIMGAGALLRPGVVLTVFGATADTAALRNEVRAVYGGFGLAMAALLLAGDALGAFAPGVRLTAGVALLGMAAGRVIGLCTEWPGRWPLAFGIVEVAFGAALLAVARA